MPFDFDQIIDRRHTQSAKYKFYDPEVLPMWVADMDFRAPPDVIDAVRAQAEHGIYGYELVSENLLALIQERLERLYSWRVTPKDIIAIPGLVTGFNVAARAVCQPREAFLVQPPVYFPMLDVSKNTGLLRQEAPLTAVANGHTLRYDSDFEAFEAAITDRTRLFLFCHPHNPVGKIFNRTELTRLADICLRHNLIICSDEIHSELLLGGASHIPIATIAPEVAQRTITLIAPSKTFNTPGLFCGFAIIPNPDLRQQFQDICNQLVLHVASFGLTAAEAAFSPATDEWLTALRAYLTANRDTLVDYVAEFFPGVRTTVPEATYLAWLDCRDLNLPETPFEFFLKHAKVALSDGATFGVGGEGCVRLNFACPRATLLQGLEQMRAALRQR